MSSSVYGNRIREFFAWWLAELAGMLPSSNSIAGKNTQRGLIVRLDEKNTSLQWEERQTTEVVATKFTSALALEKYNHAIHKDKKLAVDTCSIQLPNKKILRRLITLPSSTEENLQNVVSYEMDRYTPFSKDDVYFDVKVKERNQKDQKITVELSVIKKTILDEVIEFASASNISIQNTFVVVSEEGDSVEHFAFIQDQGQSNAQRNPSKVNKYLAILAVLLALVALALPIVKNYWQAELYKSELLVMDEDVNQVRALQAKYKAIKQDVDFIAQQTSHSMQALDLLNELSKIVPDDTSLTRLLLEDGVVRVRGNSKAASRLISIIDSSENFVGVRFVAPVTQNSKTGKESFTIEFQLQGEEHDAANSE